MKETAIYSRVQKKSPVNLRNPHLWVTVAMFAIGIVLHYPQQILGVQSPSLLTFIGLSHHAVERTLFLIPVTYAGMFLGLRAGIISLVATAAVTIPRVILIESEFRPEAIVESTAVLLLGSLINIWFELKRRENEINRQLIERLEESERGVNISEQKYRNLFESASDAIWLQDVNGLFTDGNRAFTRLTGFTPDELRGVQLAKFLSPESLNLAREIRNKLIHNQEFEQPYEQQFYVKDGSIKTVKMSTNAIFAGGRITGFEHVARDVTLEKQQQENVRSYIQQITRVQEEERKRIARDLHDDVSPDILILIQKLDKITSGQRVKVSTMKENIEGLRGQAVKALEALRRCAQGLRPRIIDDLGLAAALEWIGEELEQDQGINVSVEVTGLDRELTPETQIVLFRIAQEALNNIRKHADASEVTIKVTGSPEGIIMTVKDNGRGFNVPDRAEDLVGGGRLGLMGMYERARLLDGTLHIQSSPGQGTELVITLPWSSVE